MQNLNITFIQSNLAWKDHKANLSSFSAKIAHIAQQTDLIILPEMFNTGFVVQPQEIDKSAAPESLTWMKQTANQLNIPICGSMIVEEEEKYYNRFYWVLPNGDFETYNKRHLFSLGNEHLRFTKGTENITIEYKGWKIRPLICYDLRFPVWAKNTFIDGDYAFDLLIYAANWPAARSYAWKQLLVARAIENQCYVVGVNRIGLDGNQTPHQGDSGVIDSKGELISALVPNEESIQTIELNAADLMEYRSKFTVGLDWDDFRIL
jgi:predicted amidohydrolase